MHNNVEESHRHKFEWKKSDTRVYSGQFHLYKVKNQAKLLYGVKSLADGYPWGHKGFRAAGYVLFLDLNAGYMDIPSFQN